MKATSTDELRQYLIEQIELYEGLVREAKTKVIESDRILKDARLLIKRMRPEDDE